MGKVLWFRGKGEEKRLTRDEARQLEAKVREELAKSDKCRDLVAQLSFLIMGKFKDLDENKFKFAIAVASTYINASLRYYAFQLYRVQKEWKEKGQPKEVKQLEPESKETK